MNKKQYLQRLYKIYNTNILEQATISYTAIGTFYLLSIYVRICNIVTGFLNILPRQATYSIGEHAFSIN